MALETKFPRRPLVDECGAVRVLAALKGDPLLLSSQEKIEARYVRNTQFGSAFIPNGYYILNLQTNKETAIPGILGLMDARAD